MYIRRTLIKTDFNAHLYNTRTKYSEQLNTFEKTILSGVRLIPRVRLGQWWLVVFHPLPSRVKPMCWRVLLVFCFFFFIKPIWRFCFFFFFRGVSDKITAFSLTKYVFSERQKTSHFNKTIIRLLRCTPKTLIYETYGKIARVRG